MRASYRWLTVATSLTLVLSVLVTVSAGPVRAAASKHATKAKTTATNRTAACKGKRPRATGTAIFSDWEFPDTLNIYQTGELVSAEVYQTMLNGLVAWNNKVKLESLMLSKVPTIKNGMISKNGLNITLQLKQGLRWSNGTEITARDIKFGWRVDSDSLTGPACSGSCDAISRIDVPSKYVAVLHFKTPYAPAVPNALPDVWPTSWPGAWSNDPHAAAQKLGQDQTFNFEGPNFPTDGPYQVATFVRNDRITLHPMKYYDTMSCGGYVQNMIFAFYSSKPDLIAAAANHSTDLTTDYTAADYSALNQNTSVYKVVSAPSFLYEHLRFNVDPTFNGAPNPLHDANVRVALALALDKYAVLESALGITKKQASQIIGWSPWINTRTLTQLYADKQINGTWDPIQKKFVIPGTATALADARKILGATQYKDGFTVQGYTTSGNPVRQAQYSVVQADWAKLGVKFVPNFIPASTYFADWTHGGTLSHGNFQVAMYANEVGPDPDALKFNMMSTYIERERTTHPCAPCGNDSAIHDAVFDRDFPAASRTFNPAKRAALYAAIQVELAKMAYWDVLYFRPEIYTMDKKVTGSTLQPTGTASWNSWAWHSKSS